MRPSKDEYYLSIAEQVSKRSTCLRAKIGAVIIKNDVIVSTGYVGAPRGVKDSLERGFCLRDKLGIPHGRNYEICRSVHAEQNAIINAARSGVSILSGDMYIYGENGDGKKIDAFPCFICKKMIINAGLERVVCSTKEGGMRVFRIKDWVEEWKEGDVLDDKYQYGKDQNND